MKKIVLWCIAVLFTYSVTAQQDIKAKKILDEAGAKIGSLESIIINFIFTMDNKEMDIHEKNEGILQLKGQKYLVEIPEVGVKVYSDGETLWNYMEDGNQVTISNLEDGGSELMDPSVIFTIHEMGFRSKYAGEKKAGNKLFHQIELYPDSEEYEVDKILVSVDSSDKMIKSAALFATDGNLYGVEVTKIETGMNLSDSHFVFNPKEYNDLEIIDFR